MKILFIQLPLIDHSYGYVNGNIDYASAVISSYIKKNFNDVICRTLPSVLSNFCSDEMITKYAVSESPDVICFTSYLWNVERNLRLSGMIRDSLDSVLILFGGPEISEGSIALSSHHPEVDIFISGEGEWFFESFLSGRDIRYINVENNSVAVQSGQELVSEENIVEPLSANRLNTLVDGSVFIELTRGCPYKCSYCFYSKNQQKVRELPFTILTDVIKNRKEIKEIYILSPTFDRSKDFISNLKTLKSMNHQVNLHTEIRTDRITPEIAELMYDAGFRSLEVGLQSMNKKALGSVQRDTDPEKELDGIENLAEAGIDLKIGIIPGLPGDDLKSFIKTIDVLCDRGFGDFIELYPLMILPGTAIREKSEKDKISFQNKPPYYFIEGWNFKAENIKQLSLHMEKKTGMSAKVFYLPDFTNPSDSLFTRGLVFNSDTSTWPVNKISSEVDTIVTDLHITVNDAESFYSQLNQFIEGADQGRLYNIVLYTGDLLDDASIIKIVKDYEKDNFYRRLNVFNSFSEGAIFHFFHITESMTKYLDTVKKYSFINPVLKVNNSTLNEILKNDFNDIPLLIENGMYPEIKEFLLSAYNENPEYVAFKNENEMEAFYNDLGLDAVKFPFNFGLKQI
ncbi:MAG: hypothetical protein CVV49_05950 [Spirochaetae bacterium HGW-Spirochaetae-5]|nr:MAG: hypothetical protein CVV49_05950 [Spirochaetae bacterium HGW-Spirochaetae-5]